MPRLTPKGRMRALIELRDACADGVGLLDEADPWGAADITHLWWLAEHFGVEREPAKAAVPRAERAAEWATLAAPVGGTAAGAADDADWAAYDAARAADDDQHQVAALAAVGAAWAAALATGGDACDIVRAEEAQQRADLWEALAPVMRAKGWIE